VQFGRELRVVGQLELAHPMRLEAVSAPYPLHRADADRGRLGHCRTGPMAGRWRRARERQGHHPFCHLRAQPLNTRRPRLGAPKPSGPFLAETFLPAPDHRLGLAGVSHDRRRAAPQAGGGRPGSIGCSFVRAFPRLAHASPTGNPQANRNVRFDPLVPQTDASVPGERPYYRRPI
jgi:hypothetical protein